LSFLYNIGYPEDKEWCHNNWHFKQTKEKSAESYEE